MFPMDSSAPPLIFIAASTVAFFLLVIVGRRTRRAIDECGAEVERPSAPKKPA
jgi:hypothetical protein